MAAIIDGPLTWRALAVILCCQVVSRFLLSAFWVNDLKLRRFVNLVADSQPTATTDHVSVKGNTETLSNDFRGSRVVGKIGTENISCLTPAEYEARQRSRRPFRLRDFLSGFRARHDESSTDFSHSDYAKLARIFKDYENKKDYYRDVSHYSAAVTTATCSKAGALGEVRQDRLFVFCERKLPQTVGYVRMGGHPEQRIGSKIRDYNSEQGGDAPSILKDSVEWHRWIGPSSELPRESESIDIQCRDENSGAVRGSWNIIRSLPTSSELGPVPQPQRSVMGPDVVFHLVDSCSYPVATRQLQCFQDVIISLKNHGLETFPMFGLMQSSGGTGANLPRYGIGTTDRKPSINSKQGRKAKWVSEIYESAYEYATSQVMEGTTEVWCGGTPRGGPCGRDHFIQRSQISPRYRNDFNLTIAHASPDWRRHCAYGDFISGHVFRRSRDFWRRTRDWRRPRFQYIYMTNCHESSRQMLSLLDLDISKHVTWLVNKSFGSTGEAVQLPHNLSEKGGRPLIYFLISDHGSKYGRFRGVGTTEGDMPMLTILVSSSLLTDKMRQALLFNAQVAIDAHDIHATLLDIPKRFGAHPDAGIPTLGQSLFGKLQRPHCSTKMPCRFKTTRSIPRKSFSENPWSTIANVTVAFMNKWIEGMPCHRLLPERVEMTEIQYSEPNIFVAYQYNHPGRGSTSADKKSGILPGPVSLSAHLVRQKSGLFDVVAIERISLFKVDEVKCGFDHYSNRDVVFARSSCLCNKE